MTSFDILMCTRYQILCVLFFIEVVLKTYHLVNSTMLIGLHT